MSKQWWKNKNVRVIIVCLAGILLVYNVDLYRLAYRLTAWQSLGELTVAPTRILSFINDTPNLISYDEKETGERVTCAKAVAYVQTQDAQMIRCCQAENKNSCVTADFSSDIPTADPTCADNLRATFGIPTSAPGTKDYLISGSCPEGGNPEVTVAQIDANGQIQWKTLTVFELGLVSGALRCILAPLLFLLAARTIIVMKKKADPEREMRKW